MPSLRHGASVLGNRMAAVSSRRGASRSFWTMASEIVPWNLPEWRKLTPQAQALYYAICHGPYNGRSMANLTTGLNVAYVAALATNLGWNEDSCSEAMRELERVGLVRHDWEIGLTLAIDHVWPADNASHVQGLLNRLKKKLPESPIVAEYVRLLCTKTRAAAEDWRSDRDEAEETLNQLEDMFPLSEGEDEPPF